jgi:hypothetical protein
MAALTPYRSRTFGLTVVVHDTRLLTTPRRLWSAANPIDVSEPLCTQSLNVAADGNCFATSSSPHWY